MARQWVKLWVKQLDNPEIAELPDYLYRRWTEMLLFAGRHDADGMLPPVKVMAYVLRLSEAKLSENLTALSAVGVVHQGSDGSWHVTNWKKHQFSDSTDRVRKFREKQKEKEESAVPPSDEERYSNKNVTARYSALPSPLISSILISSDSNLVSSDSESESIERIAERLTGLMVTAADVPILNAWQRDGVTEDDIRDALQWRVDNGRPPVKTIHQLEGGVATSHSKRVQGASARANGRGKRFEDNDPEKFVTGDFAEWVNSGRDDG